MWRWLSRLWSRRHEPVFGDFPFDWDKADEMKLTLIRHKATSYATYGRLFAADGTELCVTIERPWVDLDANGKRDANVSRFVPGTYRCIRRESPKRGYPVWWLCGVPDVSLAHFPDEPTCTTAQIHIANIAEDLNGCIGVGSAFGRVKERDGVTGSKHAFDKLMTETKDATTLELEVVGP